MQPNRTSGSKGSLSVHRKLSVQCCPSVTALWHKTDHLKSVTKRPDKKRQSEGERCKEGEWAIKILLEQSGKTKVTDNGYFAVYNSVLPES